MAKCGLVHHTHIVGRGFVMHAPAAADELQLTVPHQFLYVGLHCLSLLVVPPNKERHFHVYELPVGVVEQLPNHRVQDVLNLGLLDGGVGAIEVLIHCFQPANVVVRVRNQVYVEDRRIVDWAIVRVVVLARMGAACEHQRPKQTNRTGAATDSRRPHAWWT
eukprot:scaffold1381_cov386-Prasinococcus_capsulatus_cf.AAC.22